MPNIKSAAKRMKQNAVHRDHNRAERAAMRTAVKKARTAIEAEGDATAAVTTAVQTLGKMAQKGQIHKNKASRLQSRLSKAAHAAKGSVA